MLVVTIVSIACQYSHQTSTTDDDEFAEQDANTSTHDAVITGKVKGRVVHVDDGDTVTLVINGIKKKIRFSDIDAPETGKNSQRPGQRYAEYAKEQLSNFVLDQTVEADCFGSGGYGRSVCMIYLHGKNINHEMVRLGLAWANRQNKRYVRDDHVFEAEQEARNAHRGIWKTNDAIEPWIWRKRCWKEKHCETP